MPEHEDKTEQQKFIDVFLEWAEVLVMSVFVVIFIFSFMFRIVTVEGKSMMSTLYDNDLLVVSNLFYKPHNNDIVVIQSENLDKTVVKRVIAIGGQEVEIDYNNNRLLVDGVKIKEDYIKELIMYDNKEKFDQNFYNTDTKTYKYTVPEDYVFVLGDNRNMSSDSRTFGCVSSDKIIGKIIFRISSPYGSIGLID